MNPTQGLLRSTAVYSVSNILNAAIPFLILPVLTRVLPTSDYGVIAMYTAALGVVGAVTGLGTDCAVSVRFADRDQIDFPAYVWSCLLILAGSTLATLLAVTLFSRQLTALTSIPYFWLVMVVPVAAANFLCNVRLGVWLMDRKPVCYGSFQVSTSVTNMALSLAFVFSLRSWQGRIAGQSLAMGLFGLMALLSLWRGGLWRFTRRAPYLKEALAFGIPLVPHAIGICLIGLADRFIINWKLGLEQAGIYMVAVQLGMGMGVLSDAFNKAFVPWLYAQLKEGDPEAKVRIVKGTWLYFVVALAIAAAVSALSYWIVLYVAGQKFVGAAGALAWQALGQSFLGMYLMVTNYIFYSRRTRPLAFVTFFAGGVGLVLTTMLVPVLGITGAGLSFAVAMLFRFLLTWYLAQRVCPMPWFTFRETRSPGTDSPGTASEPLDRLGREER